MVEYVSALCGLYAPEVKKELKGQGMVEYALILVLVSIVAIATLKLLGPQISSIFQTISTTLGTAS